MEFFQALKNIASMIFEFSKRSFSSNVSRASPNQLPSTAETFKQLNSTKLVLNEY